jgi:5-methylcytosine-specific restriction endonuclease McrA
MAVDVPPAPVRPAPLDEHRRRGSAPTGDSPTVGGRVLVLNATYEPINVCTIRRAAVLLLKEKAEIIEHAEWELRSESLSLPRPVVIRLVTYVRVPRDTHRRKITRRAVFARDRWTCQYCGSRTSLTVDHVVPRSKGGSSSWDNIVTSCAPCNRRKGDAMLRHVGMHLIRQPSSPSPQIFIHVATPTIPAAWRAYLLEAA